MSEIHEIFSKMIQPGTKSLFPPLISSKRHVIFLKYSSNKYRSYIINQYKILCNKLIKKEDQREIFFLSILYNDLILYNCGNEPIISNLYLLIFCCFYLSLKSRKCQAEIMKINTVKKLLPGKFNNYSNKELRIAEVLCLKLLDYKLDYMTSYDLIVLHLNKKNNFKEKMLDKYYNEILDLSVEYLNEIIELNDIRDYIFRPPVRLAQEIYYSAKKKINENNLLSIYRNNIDNFKTINSPGIKSKIREIEITKNPIESNSNTPSTNNNSSSENIPSFKKTAKNNSTKAIYMDPFYSITTTSNRASNKMNINNRTNSIIDMSTKHCRKISAFNIKGNIFLGNPKNTNEKKYGKLGTTRYLININELKKNNENNNVLLYSSGTTIENGRNQKGVFHFNNFYK